MTLRLKYIPVMLTTESAYLSDYSSAHSLEAVVCLAKPFRQDRSHMCAPVRSREPSGPPGAVFPKGCPHSSTKTPP